jgi:hypothetical protein
MGTIRGRGVSPGLALGVVALAAVAAFAACKKKSEEPANQGTVGDAGPPITARVYFVRTVFPQLNSTCGQCHGGDGPGSTFLAKDAEGAYTAVEASLGLIAAPSKSPLTTYTHKDPTVGKLTAQQRNTLSQWLTLEATERGLAGAVAAPKTLADAYKAFKECSRYDVWRRAGMDRLSYTQTDKEGPCMGCHSTGQGGVYLAAAGRDTYKTLMEFPYIQKLIVGTVDSNGVFDTLVPAGRIIEKSNEVCPEGSDSCHPTYGLPPQVELAINIFVQTTLENLRGGTCDNLSGIVDVTDAGTGDAGDGGGR